MEIMGMTDKQFNGFLRFIIKDLEDTKKIKNIEEKEKSIDEIIENLKRTLED